MILECSKITFYFLRKWRYILLSYVICWFEKNIKTIITIIILGIILQIISINIPILSAKLIDSLVSKNINNGARFLRTLVVLLVSNLILQYFFKVFKVRSKQQLMFYFQRHSIVKIYKEYLEINSVKNNTVLSQNMVTDSEVISEFVVENIVDLLNYTIIMCASIYMLSSMNEIFFFVAIMSLPLYIILTLKVSPKVKKEMRITKELEGDYSSAIVRIYQSISLIKKNVILNKLDGFLETIFKNKFDHYFQTYKLLYFFYSFGSIFTVGIQIIYYYLGIVLISKNEITIGEFTIILSFYNFMLTAVNFFLSFFGEYTNFITSWKRLNEHVSINIDNVQSNLQKTNIDTLYSICWDDFVWNIGKNQFYFPKVKLNLGDVLLLEGENGTGKTTLVNILTGLYKPPLNRIKFNDICIENIDLNKMRDEQIAVCDTDATFIIDNVLEILRVYSANYELTADEIFNFIKVNNLETMYLNIEKMLNRKFSSLSTGQKKKIVLMISFLRESKLLILDEPTIGLDKSSKNCLLNYLNSISGKIVIVITHEDFFKEKLMHSQRVTLTN